MQLNRVILKFENFVFITNKGINYASMLVLACMMFLVAGDILGRVFNRPIYGAYELTSIGLVLVVFLSLGFTLLNDGHIAITFIVEKFPIKVQAILDTILYAAFSILIFLLNWQLIVHVMRTNASNEVTMDLNIPIFLFVGVAAIGSFLFLLALLLKMLKSIAKVVAKK